MTGARGMRNGAGTRQPSSSGASGWLEAGEAEAAAVGPAGSRAAQGPLAHGFAGDQRLARIVKRKLKKIQYPSHLIDG